MPAHTKKAEPQTQNQQPGDEYKMHPRPDSFMESYKAAGKLKGKVAVVTGGDSGIGRAACIAFAKEGADIAIIYLNEDRDAKETERHIRAEGRDCLLIPGDIGHEDFCQEAIKDVAKHFGRIDILVNNAAEQHLQESIEDISAAQLERTFRTNIFSMFYLTKAALPHMKAGSTIINTTSVTAYKGKPELLDYSSTKGAIVSFTRSLSQQLAEKEIRVNAVAPGPIWTPLIPASFDAKKTGEHGANAKLGHRPGQPDEVAPSYVFLASSDSSYMTGQVLHVNGGEIVNG